MWKGVAVLITFCCASDVDHLGSCDAWKDVQGAMWEAVESRTLNPSDLPALQQLVEMESGCMLGTATALAIFGALQPSDEYLMFFQDVLQDIFDILPSAALSTLIRSDFPLFGALDWLSEQGIWGAADCWVHGRQFQAVLQHHLGTSGTPQLPAMAAVDFLTKQAAKEGSGQIGSCFTGRAVASLSFLLTHSERLLKFSRLTEEAQGLLKKAETLLREETERGSADDSEKGSKGSLPPLLERLLSHEWKVPKLLHEISRKLNQVHHQTETAETAETADGQGCLILIYTFPTDEIRQDTREALRSLEKYFVSPLELHERPRMVVFVDQETADFLDSDVRPYTTLEVVPAIIPQEELTREMNSYSCQDGAYCVSGEELPENFHRGNVNRTQFWSPAYLRISRYTAGPLFQHPQLDSCNQFIKIDTDFFFTAPVEDNPLKKMRDEGVRLTWWQMHVQGQRQTGYIEAALDFLEAEELAIRNSRFYARGRFEQKANEAGIPLWTVPAANEASTVLYGCLFGGDVQFFREPLYQSFFTFMDEKKGFENHGWSNQFFLGTAAAAFLPRSQLQRLYISGRHQECLVTVADGNVTEFLRGAEYGMAR